MKRGLVLISSVALQAVAQRSAYQDDDVSYGAPEYTSAHIPHSFVFVKLSRCEVDNREVSRIIV